MEARTQLAPGYQLWEVPGKPLVVHTHLGVGNRLVAEVTWGEAARKRGVPVTGVLIGTIERGDPVVVRVEDFETIDKDDDGAFEDACRKWQPDESRQTYAVGYFRARQSEGFSLAERDLEILDRFFPSPWHIAMLINPSGSQVKAGFFFREDGVFQRITPLEFPIGPKQSTPQETPRKHTRETRTLVPEVVAQVQETVTTLSHRDASPNKRLRGGWVWIPLSFIFLLLGVLLGFQAALTMAPRASENRTPDFGLGLSVSRTDNNLSVKWDRDSAAIHAALRGTLDIRDGNYSKSVPLDAAQLQNGNILYRNSSNSIRFQLVVYPKEGVSITEVTEWKQ